MFTKHKSHEDTGMAARAKTLRAAVFGMLGGVALTVGVSVLANDGAASWMQQASVAHMSQAEMDRHIDKMSQHLFIEIDASDAQKEKLQPILKKAANDLMPLVHQLHAGHTDVINLLTAPAIDRAALEAQRASQVALADQISKRITAVLADSGDILSQDQRKKLVAHLCQHAGMHGMHHG